MTDVPRIPSEVLPHLGYYVYLYIDPRDGRPFYVGKGQGERVLAHLSEAAESRKSRTIEALRALGLAPRLEVLAHGLESDEVALRIEAAVIDLLGLDHLTNTVRGWRSVQLGRMSLEDLIAYYAAKPVELIHPALLIRINRLYRHGMTDHDIYEATRGVWKLGPRREEFGLALAVFEGVVRGVYQIESWHRAGTTEYETRPHETVAIEGRWEFLGRPANEAIRSRYLLRSVAKYFPSQGGQSPVVYVKPPGAPRLESPPRHRAIGVKASAGSMNEAEITEPALLIRINRLYHHGMSGHDLYEATRGVWKLGPRREHYRLALAVYQGIVCEAFRINSWHPAGSTPYASRPRETVALPDRWEFLGDVAEPEVRDRYVGRSVARFFAQGQQNPVTYVDKGSPRVKAHTTTAQG